MLTLPFPLRHTATEPTCPIHLSCNLFKMFFSSQNFPPLTREICIAHIFLVLSPWQIRIVVCLQYTSPVPTLSSKMVNFSLPQSLNRIGFCIWRRLGWKCSTYFPQITTKHVSQLRIVCLLSVPHLGHLLLFSPHFLLFFFLSQNSDPK